MIKIEGINYEDMQQRLMCDEETCLLILATFRKEVQGKLNMLLVEQDRERFVTLAHGIKGSCANVSALECFEIAKNIEYKARELGREACEGELQELVLRLNELFLNLQQFMMGNKQPENQEQSSEDEDLFFLQI